MQIISYKLLNNRQVEGNEDNCLSLNIYTPDENRLSGGETSSLVPTIIWIHGGGFSFGSGSDFFYGPLKAMVRKNTYTTVSIFISFVMAFIEAKSNNKMWHPRYYLILVIN